MDTIPDNVVAFPRTPARFAACPHCGTRTDHWRLGRILWGFCESHEVRWVAADFGQAAPVRISRAELRGKLEFLSRFAEVSRARRR